MARHAAHAAGTAAHTTDAAQPHALPPSATAPSTLRGRLPSLSAVQLQALRSFFGAPQRWLLPDQTELRLAPCAASPRDECMRVDADGARIALRFDASAAALDGERLQWSDYGGRSRLLAWALAHERALMRMSDALGVGLMPVEGDGDDTLFDTFVWLAFAIDDDRPDGDPLPSVRGALGLTPEWMSRLLARAEPVYDDDPLPSIAAWRGVPLPLGIHIDGPTLQRDAWDALNTGDVLLLGATTGLRCAARGAGRQWPLSRTPAGWRVDGPARHAPRMPASSAQEPHPMTDTAPSTERDTTAADAADAAARALPVQLSFEIGQLEISIGEMAALQPGYVFALPVQLEGANVTLRANGRIAGRGELVAIGETLGVRLLSWAT